MSCIHVLLAERLQKTATMAKSMQEVHETLDIAFSPSQGSTRRAKKFKQFSVDVMPAGSEVQVLLLTYPGALLTSVSCHWLELCH